jgi:hypothetical protein
VGRWCREIRPSSCGSSVVSQCLTYNGPTLWQTEPQPGFPDGVPIIPIAPMKTTWQTHSKTYSRTQLPLRLAWAVTVHKSQGLTIPKMRLALGRREFSSGLTFVALSRVKELNNLIFIETLDYSRVKKLGGKQLQLRRQDRARRYHE